ncbi:MAG: TolC family protein [Candidatus Omnitrophica bacterium]|nr:TolC family protein [Candidatus Omnitrophota bacterium]
MQYEYKVRIAALKTMNFSKNTLKLLKLFYSHPDEEFYIQQLGRILKKKPGVFQRNLYNLEKEGVLKSDYRANARFFRANKNYSFYNEFKSITFKALSVLLVLLLSLMPLVSYEGICQEEANVLVLSSLNDAIKIAFKGNKDISIQEYSIKVAKADIVGSRSAFLPKVDFDAAYTHTNAVLSSADSNAKKDTKLFTGYKNQNEAGIAISEVLYSGGANLAAYRASQLALREQEETLRATKLNVELETKRLYYGLLLAYETKRIAEDLVKQAESHYQQVKARFEQGTSSKFDVLQSKVQVSLLMPQLINAENAVDLIVAELNKLLGLKINNRIIINDNLSYLPIEIKEEEFLREAYLNEPEMILKGLGIDISKWSIKYARAGWLPKVEAGGQYYYRSNNALNMFNDKHNNWNIGLTFRLSLFDGFSTKAKVDSAKAKYMQSVIGKENLADQVAVEVKQACLDLNQAYSIIKSQEDNLQDAKEALEISYVRYNNGVGINLDVLDAQVSLANVEKNLSEGIYDYLMGQARLDRIMGREIKIEEAAK